MNRWLPFLLLTLLGCGGSSNHGFGGTPTRGALIDYEEIRDYGEASMDTVLDYIEWQSGISLSVTSDVTLYKVEYQTIDEHGQPTAATGAVAIPDTPTNPALVAYQHSTATSDKNIPSENNDEAWAVLAIFAATGNYVVSMPDYLGLGGSSVPVHPYVHAASEASAGLDLMRAARLLCKKLNVKLSNKVFVTGYSQGGHAAMALTQTIEGLGTSEFSLTASAPCSGPYDLSGSQLAFSLETPSVDTPLFMSYVTLAYREVYGILPDLTKVFVSPYDARVPPLFNGQFDLDDISKALPSDLSKLYQAAFIQSVKTDPANPLVVGLKANDNYNWKPRTPMTLFAGKDDEVVTFQNSQVAHDTMKANGATVDLVDYGANITHVNGFYYAIPKARLWFDTLNNGTSLSRKRGAGRPSRVPKILR